MSCQVADWRALLLAVLHEPNLTSLEKLTYELEAALFFRFQELAHEPDGHPERDEIRAAVIEMRSIRIKKLGWPDPRDTNRQRTKV